MFFVIEVNPGITLDQFALAVELEDNYQTDSYDLEYPGLIMTIRFFFTKNLYLGSEEGYPHDFNFKVDQRLRVPPFTDLPVTVWK